MDCNLQDEANFSLPNFLFGNGVYLSNRRQTRSHAELFLMEFIISSSDQEVWILVPWQPPVWSDRGAREIELRVKWRLLIWFWLLALCSDSAQFLREVGWGKEGTATNTEPGSNLGPSSMLLDLSLLTCASHVTWSGASLPSASSLIKWG